MGKDVNVAKEFFQISADVGPLGRDGRCGFPRARWQMWVP